MYYLGWAQAFLFGWVIPWYFWACFGLAGGVLIFLFLPLVVTFEVRQLLATIAVAVGFIISAVSWGQAMGISLENERWTRMMQEEQARLTEGFKGQLMEEMERRAKAEAGKALLTGQLEEIDREADAEQDAGYVVVPEPTARKLHNLRPNYTKGDHR